jgi:dihydroorotate dehydrogenase
MYSFIRKCLFSLDPEKAHYLTLNALQIAYQLGLIGLITKTVSSPQTVMGLTFPNRVGLAAGLDKNADYIETLSALGFGFIEIGTVTPKPQEGNPRPRLFRLANETAIINRLGFNSKGIDYVVKKLEKMRYQGILGINIGKNRDTPNEKAIEDYVIGFQRFWKYASYITINISSPNTQGLRDLQKSDSLSALLIALKHEQKAIQTRYNKYVPLVVKISPDLSEQELNEVAEILLEQQVDGVIATNTTVHREGIEQSFYKHEIGGLSGLPLQNRSTAIIKQLHTLLQNKIPIIGVGGIVDKTSGREKFAAGASLIQIYTGLIYAGPGLISELAAI